MTDDEFRVCLRAYSSRRPFRTFLIEFFSGEAIAVTHLEAVDRRGPVYYYRGPQGAQSVFPTSSVCRLLDPPTS